MGWSTDPTFRVEFRQIGFPVQHHAKDLGAHVAFSRQRTNRTLQDRLDNLEPLRKQIKTSKATYALKLLAWPRGLFAVATAPLGNAAWLKHRRRAVQALSADKTGVNPFVLLGVVEPMVDPQLLALLHTVREARDFWSADLFLHAVGSRTVCISLCRASCVPWWFQS